MLRAKVCAKEADAPMLSAIFFSPYFSKQEEKVMATAKKIYLDCFGTWEQPLDGVLLQIDVLALEDRGDAKANLRLELVKHCAKGDLVMLVVKSETPIGVLNYIYMAISEITGGNVIVQQQKEGLIPSHVFTVTHIDVAV